MDRGGKGLYLGGLTEFEQYASHYYNIVPSTNKELEEAIAAENMNTLLSLKLEQENAPKVNPLRVCVTNASSSVAYHLSAQIATGKVFGEEERVALHLYDCSTDSKDLLEGLALELVDLASPVLHEVRVATSVSEAMDSVSWAFILDHPYQPTAGTKEEENPHDDEVEPSSSVNGTLTVQTSSTAGEEPVSENKQSPTDVEKQSSHTLPVIQEATSLEKEEENRTESTLLNPTPDTAPSELVSAARLYHCYGATMDFASQKDIRVIVCGRYANTGAALMAKAVSSIDKSNFIASPCLAEHQAKAIIANKLSLNGADISQVALWGHTCGKVFADITHVRVMHYPGAVVGPDPYDLPLTRCVFETEWLEGEFSKLFESRHTRMEGYQNSGPIGGASLVEAIGLVKLTKQWREGSRDGWRCVGVANRDSEPEGGGYGVPVGVAFSQPACLSEGKWSPVQDLATTEKVKVH